MNDEGVIVLEFGVHITDGSGNDIYVFEVSSDVGQIKVEISDDLTDWIYVGDASGYVSGVDINGKIPAGKIPPEIGKYRYVRLTNQSGKEVKIDAVAVLHPVKIGSGNIADDIEFTDAKGNKVKIPCGELSCATFVVEFIRGNPWTSDPRYMYPEKILGKPDYNNSTGENSVTLGSGGIIVVGFNVYITDGPGNDIYVFEIGPAIEPTRVEVSNDLKNWIYVGDANGSTSGVDINGKVPAGEKYKYVRLTDLKSAPGPETPGADIDAVAIIYPAFK